MKSHKNKSNSNNITTKLLLDRIEQLEKRVAELEQFQKLPTPTNPWKYPSEPMKNPWVPDYPYPHEYYKPIWLVDYDSLPRY